MCKVSHTELGFASKLKNFVRKAAGFFGWGLSPAESSLKTPSARHPERNHETHPERPIACFYGKHTCDLPAEGRTYFELLISFNVPIHSYGL